MRRQLATAALALAACLCTGSTAATDTGQLLAGFARARATIETSLACHLLDIRIAETAQQRAQGLMFVRDLGEYEGMLFPGREPAILRMWMKNTYIPLDMLFIGADGHVAGIHANATPLSEATISSPGPVLGVLELNGGFAARHDIRPGDRFTILQ